jgi:hypothetical protein
MMRLGESRPLALSQRPLVEWVGLGASGSALDKVRSLSVLVTSQALLRRQPRIFLAVTLKSMLKFEATRVPRPERGIAWLGDGNLGVRRQYVFEEDLCFHHLKE